MYFNGQKIPLLITGKTILDSNGDPYKYQYRGKLSPLEKITEGKSDEEDLYSCILDIDNFSALRLLKTFGNAGCEEHRLS